MKMRAQANRLVRCLAVVGTLMAASDVLAQQSAARRWDEQILAAIRI